MDGLGLPGMIMSGALSALNVIAYSNNVEVKCRPSETKNVELGYTPKIIFWKNTSTWDIYQPGIRYNLVNQNVTEFPSGNSYNVSVSFSITGSAITLYGSYNGNNTYSYAVNLWFIFFTE